MATAAAYQLGVAVIIALVFYHYSRKKDGLSLPPGPKPYPLIGNILDLPPQNKPAYEHWLKFKDQYGPISSLNILGKTMVIIHDNQAAHELLGKKSAITSTRPDQPFANDLCGFGVLLPNQKFTDKYKYHRKLIHQQLGTRPAAAQFHDIEDVESRRFLLRVLKSPENLVQHIKTEAAAIMLKITYGYSIEPEVVDPVITLLEKMVECFSHAFVPLTWAVDIIPALRYLPGGFPGASFHKTARKWNKIAQAAVDVPYAFARQQMSKGTHQPSYVSTLVSQCNTDGTPGNEPKLSERDEDAIKLTANIVYGGGSDTTLSTIMSVLLALIVFPEVQKKAQEEIDDVVGVGKLPTFEHRPRLPYINALVKESFRWFPVVPVGTTHVTEEETTVSGFRIPKGSYLLPAIWWFLHDPKTYANPEAFDPERFLEPRNEPDPATEAFGYGRRICVGRYVANDSLYLTLSRFLAVFNIRKAIDAQGNEIHPKVEHSFGLIDYPANFPYRIEPRSEEHMELIRSVEIEHPWGESDAAVLKALWGDEKESDEGQD